jgi:cell wall-associated NlpC family hydrolase
VEQARSWLGVPFHWGSATRHGTDCVGLILGVGWELRLTDYRPANYGREWDTTHLFHGLSQIGRRVDLVLPCWAPEEVPCWLEAGQILLFTVRRRPQHLAIYAGHGRMIHADESIGRVVENGIDAGWARRLHAVYEWRGLHGLD